MLLMGMHIQLVEVVLADESAMAEQSLPISAMIVLLGLVIVCGLLRVAAKFSLLSRQELFCVFFCMVLSAPMMTQGMWHRFVGLIAAPPRKANFGYLDAYNDKLWPHGPNLVEGGFSEANRNNLTVLGNDPLWREVEYNEGERAVLPILKNDAPEDVTSLTLTVPVGDGAANAVEPGEPYLVSCLVRAEGLGPNSFYFIRIATDERKESEEIINSREPGKTTFIQRRGFLRVGSYGVTIPPDAQKKVRLEIGLWGSGSVALHDPKLLNVSALEGIYKGRAIIRRSEYEKLPPDQRIDLVVKPDNMWSVDGLRFLVSGYIPLGQWLETAIAWSTPIFLLLVGMLAVNVLMRRQWADNQRYQFPLFQIPRAILGAEDQSETQAFASVWRNGYLWAGLAVALVWGGMKGWHFYNPKVPDASVSIYLSDYISDPGWGEMWKVKFTVGIIFLSICMFFELNVLISLVIGFFAFRALFWLGESANLKMYQDYPFRNEQAIGAYLGYAAVVLFLARKYLWRVLTATWRNDKSAWDGEVFSYRTALGLLVAVFVGLAFWAWWLGVPASVIGAFFAFLLLIGLVAAKFRAECGIPGGYFTPYNAMLFVSLLGGMTLFGPEGVLICLVFSGFLTVSVFFFIPGAQLELLEYGRRYRVVPRHLLYTAVLGILGGLFIGGWVFLSNAYAMGGENMRYQWAFEQNWYFYKYTPELAAATSEYVGGESVSGGVEPSTYAYAFGAVAAMALTALRQVFAGFWFHPIGFVLGSSFMMEWVWGSVLTACAIRFVVLKLGGAATVRNKLMPFFVGMFIGGVVLVVILNCYAGYLRAHGVERILTGGLALP